MSDALTIDGQCADCGQPISRTESGGWCHWDTTAWPAHASRPVTGRDAEREQLAAALKANGYREATHAGILDVLLPVVDRIANERAAAMLRAAADWIWDDVPALASASAELHARADHLDPS